MIILHGENLVKSRQKLAQLIERAKLARVEILRLEAKKLAPQDLELALGETSLFGNNKLIIIENLHSLPRSKRKNELITSLSQNKFSGEIILSEKRSLTATMLKKFPKAKVEEFKASKALFSWLDKLIPKNNKPEQLKLLQTALEQDGEHFCFLMLIRQIRMMLQVKSGGQLKGHPFVISKVKQQAQNFSLTQLLKLHEQLLKLDIKHKTSTNYLSLANELEFLNLSL